LPRLPRIATLGTMPATHRAPVTLTCHGPE
jgi:hypothetical protein